MAAYSAGLWVDFRTAVLLSQVTIRVNQNVFALDAVDAPVCVNCVKSKDSPVEIYFDSLHLESWLSWFVVSMYVHSSFFGLRERVEVPVRATSERHQWKTILVMRFVLISFNIKQCDESLQHLNLTAFCFISYDFTHITEDETMLGAGPVSPTSSVLIQLPSSFILGQWHVHWGQWLGLSLSSETVSPYYHFLTFTLCFSSTLHFNVHLQCTAASGKIQVLSFTVNVTQCFQDVHHSNESLPIRWLYDFESCRRGHMVIVNPQRITSPELDGAFQPLLIRGFSFMNMFFSVFFLIKNVWSLSTAQYLTKLVQKFGPKCTFKWKLKCHPRV